MKRRALIASLPALALSRPCMGQPAAPRAHCIAPAKPGGGFDLTCQLARDMLRLAAPPVEVQVSYLPGGIGAVAFDRAVTQRWSDPRLFVAFSTGSLVNLAQGKFGPHEVGDVRWLAVLGLEFGVVAVRKASGIDSLTALREMLRSNPAAASFGAGGGVGSQDWMKAALLVKAAGADHRGMRFVSFEGGGQAVAALKGGHVDAFCGDAAEVRGAFMADELRLLAMLAPNRLGAPWRAVPTAREQGVDLVWPTLRGLYMGPGVLERDRAEWARSLRRVMGLPEYARLLEKYGLQPFSLTGPELESYVQQQVRDMRELAVSLNLRVR